MGVSFHGKSLGFSRAADFHYPPFNAHFVSNLGISPLSIRRQKNAQPTAKNFTLKCGNCAAYVLAFWSGSRNGTIHQEYLLPSPILVSRAPAEWPNDVGRNWVEAHRSLVVANWSAAAMTARSALQAAVRQQGGSGRDLRTEIDALAAKGILPPLMQDWSTQIRELGNDGAHPKPGQSPPCAKDLLPSRHLLPQLLPHQPSSATPCSNNTHSTVSNAPPCSEYAASAPPEHPTAQTPDNSAMHRRKGHH
jgi:hypothetical protein